MRNGLGSSWSILNLLMRSKADTTVTSEGKVIPRTVKSWRKSQTDMGFHTWGWDHVLSAQVFLSLHIWMDEIPDPSMSLTVVWFQFLCVVPVFIYHEQRLKKAGNEAQEFWSSRYARRPLWLATLSNLNHCNVFIRIRKPERDGKVQWATTWLLWC